MVPKTHKIASGDTLSVIAKREYGDSTLYNHIARYNRISNPNNVALGTVISLPVKAELTNPNKYASSSNAKGTQGTTSSTGYALILGINPSATTKFGSVDTGENPGHTIVAFKNSAGKLVKVFSYGPVNIGLREAYGCTAQGRTGYPLKANDDYKLYEWPINELQYAQATRKISDIESKPGTFTATHQCTTTSLEVVSAAGITTPSGKGDISVPMCGVTKGVSAPVFLDRELEKQFQSAKKSVPKVKGSHFSGLVAIEK